MVRGWRYLFSRGKVTQGDALGFLSGGTSMMDQAAVRPGDPRSQIRAFKTTVYSCVNLRSNAFMDVRLGVYIARQRKSKALKLTVTKPIPKARKDWMYRKALPGSALSKADDIEEVVEHPLVDVLRNVNGFLNAPDLKYLTNADMDLTGTCFWCLIRNRLGTPIAIWIIPSEYMTIKPTKSPTNQSFIESYIYKRGTRKIVYKPEDIVYFFYPTPASQWYGMAPLQGISDIYNMRAYMLEYEKNMFRTYGTPGLVIKKPEFKNMSEEALERASAKVRNKYMSVDRAGNVMLATPETTIDPLGSSPRDMGYQHGFSVTKQEILNAYGVPEALFTGQTSTRAGLEASITQLAMFATAPQCSRVDAKISEKLCPQFDSKFFVMFDNAVPEDVELGLKRSSQLVQGGIASPNEARIWEHLDSDPSPAMDEKYMPMSMVPISSLSESDQERQAEAIVRRALEKMRGGHDPQAIGS